MKSVLLALLLLSPGLAMGKVTASDYSVPVHVRSSRLVTICHDVLGHAFCGTKQSLEVAIDGKKYELLSKDDADGALRTGDYKARVLVDDSQAAADPVPAYIISYTNAYEFLFPDGRKQKFSVIGESE